MLQVGRARRFQHRARSSMCLLALLWVWGCKAEEGGSCEANEARCLDDKTQLICSEGRYVKAPCSGPRGCVELDRSVKCDFSKNAPDTSCAAGDEGAGACFDQDTLVSCRGGKYVHTPCRGPAGCQTAGDQAECDRSIATAGEPCSGDFQACDKAGTQVLSCQDGKLQALYYCRGRDGCEVEGKIKCDLSVAREGDPCGDAAQGGVACGVDAAALLVCSQGKFEIKQRCLEGERCEPAIGMRCAKP